eukprot:m.142809 g.142809  ORF g.142809 m.142809 type:complete len:669 (+) comp16167_c1_seq8:3072-5078(+)
MTEDTTGRWSASEQVASQVYQHASHQLEEPGPESAERQRLAFARLSYASHSLLTTDSQHRQVVQPLLSKAYGAWQRETPPSKPIQNNSLSYQPSLTGLRRHLNIGSEDSRIPLSDAQHEGKSSVSKPANTQSAKPDPPTTRLATPSSTAPIAPASSHPQSSNQTGDSLNPLEDQLDAVLADNAQLRDDNAALGTNLRNLTATLELSQKELAKRAKAIQSLKEEVAQLKKAARRASLGPERSGINSYARPNQSARSASYTEARHADQDDEPPAKRHAAFQTASERLALDDAERRKNGKGPAKRTGLSRRKGSGVAGAYAAPFKNDGDKSGGGQAMRRPGRGDDNGDKGDREDSFLNTLDQNLVEMIESEIMTKDPQVKWDDIAGLEYVKSLIREIVIWPLQRPDIFQGLRKMSKGILLFGPPGTGKTLIGKAIASEVKSTFFSISSSSLTSKWVGQGEKLVRALFAVARENLPAIIFIDEIDSLLTQRSEGETEGSRRIKTEFLVQLDGATTSDNEMLLILGATNRPQELDEAARRRLTRRLYVPLPDDAARRGLIQRALTKIAHAMAEADIIKVVEVTAGYSGADVAQVCTEAAMGPVREFGADIQTLDLATLRPVGLQDFMDACHTIQSSVAPSEIISYETWNDSFGTRKARPKQSAVVTPSSNGDS